MKSKTVLTLVIAGVVLAGLAWLTSRQNQTAQPKELGKTVLSNLNINAVDEIVIANNTQTARIVRAEGQWVLPDRFGHPANFEQLRKLLLTIESLEVGQAFNASDAQRAQMELTPQTTTQLTLRSAGAPIEELFLGAHRKATNADQQMPFGMTELTDGRYISRKDDPTVYLVGEELYEANTDFKRWIDTSLLEVPASDVVKITISNPKDGTFSLVKTKDNKLQFEESNDEEPFDDAKSFSLSGALNYLTMQDVANPSLDDETLGFTNPSLFQVATKDGTQYTLTVSDFIGQSEDRYVRIAVTNATALPETPVSSDDSSDTNGIAKVDSDAILAAKQQAQQLHDKLSPWTYRIVAHKAKSLTPARSSLVKKPAPDEETASDQADSSL